jgi:hypothetical protein
MFLLKMGCKILPEGNTGALGPGHAGSGVWRLYQTLVLRLLYIVGNRRDIVEDQILQPLIVQCDKGLVCGNSSCLHNLHPHYFTTGQRRLSRASVLCITSLEYLEISRFMLCSPLCCQSRSLSPAHYGYMVFGPGSESLLS